MVARCTEAKGQGQGQDGTCFTQGVSPLLEQNHKVPLKPNTTFKHYRNLCYRCVPVSLHDFAVERLHYNINICTDKKVIYIRNWDQNGDLSYEDFKAKYPGPIVNFMLCEGILRSVTEITKLNLDLNLKNLKKTVILMKHMYGNAYQAVVPSTSICILSKTMMFL